MKFDVYGRFQLEVVREGERWVVYRLASGWRQCVMQNDVDATWSAFLRQSGRGAATAPYDVFHFHDNEAGADELAALVLNGQKRATAALLWYFEARGMRPPEAGDLSVVTDFAGAPLCVIETTEVAVRPFEDVDEAFAAAEGEGDLTLKYWRRVHWAFFGRECARLGRTPSKRMPVVCERFEVVYVTGDN